MRRQNTSRYIAASAGAVIAAFGQVAGAQTLSSGSVHIDSTAATQLINVTTLRQMTTMSNVFTTRAMTRLGPPSLRTSESGQRFGMSAGEPPGKWNVWGSVSGDDNKYNDNTNKFDAKATNSVLGGDFALSPTLNLGLSAAFDRVTGNQTTAFSNTSYTTTGYSLAPYVGWQISRDWSLDATAGWGKGDIDNNNVKDKNKRVFYGTNLNYVQWFGNWQFGGKGSYLHGEEKYDASILNPSTKNKVDQWRLGAQAAYYMEGFMPYLGVAYSSDDRSTSAAGPTLGDNLGKTAWIWSLGVNFISVRNSLTGGIVYNTESGRSNSKSDTLMATVNYRF